MEQLFYNGDIITMENENDHPEAVLVRNGVIANVGNLDELREIAAPDCKMVDLWGNTLMPSFIDPHSHISMTMQQMVMADLTDAESMDDIVSILKEFMENRDEEDRDAPLFGCSYDHNFLKEKCHPTKDVLDRVSTEIPIFITHASGHMGSVNSKTLEMYNITADTPDPEGGVIGRVEGSNEPNGYLEETAVAPVRELQIHMKMNYEKQALGAEMEYISRGVTTIQDGAAVAETIKLYRHLASEGRLMTDIISYPVFGIQGDPSVVMEENKDCLNKYVNHFKIGGYKAILDGSPQGRSAWMTKPYENSGDYCGYPWMSDEVVEGYMKTAIDSNHQVLVHCNGDAASDQFLNAYEKAYKASKNPEKDKLRPVMIHCQTVRDDQLDRMKDLNMSPSIFVAHVNYWGDIHLQNFGQERGSRVSPVRSALDRGLIYNFHTDTPIVKPNMFHSIWTAVNRITRFGVLCGPEQRIGVYDALKAVTINAAYQYYEEDLKGSIRKGKYADLIIVDNNPLKVDPMAIKDIEVLATFKNGLLLYRK